MYVFYCIRCQREREFVLQDVKVLEGQNRVNFVLWCEKCKETHSYSQQTEKAPA